MESTRSHAEMMKPMLLKAGLPLALSVAGFMCAKFLAPKYILPKASLSQTHSHDSFHSLPSLVGEETDSNPIIGYSEEEVVRLKTQIQHLLLREQESALILHIAYAKRFEELAVEFTNVMNRLQKKAKRVERKTKVQSRVIRESGLMIEGREAEMLRAKEELQTSCNVRNNLEAKVKELEMLLDPSISQGNAEKEAMDKDYKEIVNELQKELIYLRWTNACLRHQLMTNRERQDKDHVQQQHEESGEDEDRDHSLDISILTDNHRFCSKRKRLIQKLKRWAVGSEMVNTRMDEDGKCFGRKSCSSA